MRFAVINDERRTQDSRALHVHLQGITVLNGPEERCEYLEEHERPALHLRILVPVVRLYLLDDPADTVRMHRDEVLAVQPTNDGQLRPADEECGRKCFGKGHRVTLSLHDIVEIQIEGLATDDKQRWLTSN